MFFQNLEFYETDNFQYLLIHKNGCTSVLESIKDVNPVYTENRNLEKICWTVIRDPYERFVSGLSYDLTRHNVDVKDVSLDKLFHSYSEKTTREKGNFNHTSSQVPYLINANVNWYVDISDLSLFLKLHFKKSYNLNNTYDIKSYFKKEDVLKYLQLDYNIYNRIINSPYLWEWQKGKIF